MCTEDVSFNIHFLSFLDNHGLQTTVLFLCFLVSTPLKHVTRSTSNATSPGEFICTVLNVRRERDIVFILHEESDRGIVDT